MTINGFKVDPTRSSQHFCPSLSMSIHASSTLSLLTRAGDPAVAGAEPAPLLVSLTFSLEPDGTSTALHLLPGYFSPRSSQCI